MCNLVAPCATFRRNSYVLDSWTILPLWGPGRRGARGPEGAHRLLCRLLNSSAGTPQRITRISHYHSTWCTSANLRAASQWGHDALLSEKPHPLCSHSLKKIQVCSLIQSFPKTTCGYRRLSLAALACLLADKHTDAAPKHSLLFQFSFSCESHLMFLLQEHDVDF